MSSQTCKTETKLDYLVQSDAIFTRDMNLLPSIYIEEQHLAQFCHGVRQQS